MSSIFVPPEGPRDARLAIVGEGPGRDEIFRGRPFIGLTGRELDELLRLAGVDRSHVYLTNVEKTTMEKPSIERSKHCLVELIREFEAMPNLNMIVGLGAIALETLTAFKQNSITRWRGSLVPTWFGAKMLATYHPAYYMRGEWRFKPIVLADLERAVRESAYPELRLPQRRYYIQPTYEEALRWLHRLESADELGVDIETVGWGWGQTYVSCIGFSPDPSEGYCIPFMEQGRRPYWTKDQEVQIWRAISRVLVAPSKKYLQNGMFDIPVLNEHHIKLQNFYMDTMLAHALMYPELPHGLDFITSVYTLEPYYKDEGKTWGQTGDIRQFWTYNCKDCCVTLEAGRELDTELGEYGMFDYFHSYTMPLTWPLMEMQRTGIMVDKERLARLVEWLEWDLKEKQSRIDAVAGRPINVKSPKDVVELLTSHGIRVTRQTKTGKPKLDDESIHEYCRQAGANYGRDVSIGNAILEVRKARTLLSNFVDISTDGDDHYHFNLLIHGTTSGRLSSRAPRDADDNPLGPQMQNVPHAIRGVFCARPGFVLVSGDLKQAEAIHVAGEGDEEGMIGIFNSGRDIHRFNGQNFFTKPGDSITKKERDVAKRLTHGFDYKMSPRKSVGVMAKAGEYITEALAKRGQDSYFAACPGIPLWHKRIEMQVRTTKTVSDPFGRRRIFLGNYDEDMLREALAQVPQSTIAYITNMAIIRLYEWFPDDCRVVLQVHDEVLCEVPESKADEMTEMVRRAMTLPYRVGRWLVTIPVDIQVGRWWHTEMKELPLVKSAPVFQEVHG